MIQEFHSYLIQYVNVARFSKWDYIKTLGYESLTLKKQAPSVLRLFEEEINRESPKRLSNSQIELEPYSGNNQAVLEMMKVLEKELKDELFGAYVHGSLATNEELKYSDFDALVILHDAVFNSEKRLADAALKLHRLQKIMHQYDPLQHHGWFVLTESMLKNYPSLYFPPNLFGYSKSLLMEKGLNFSIQTEEKTKMEYHAPFDRLAEGLLKKLKTEGSSKNSFKLKALFSEFMLLPTLFLQAKTKRGVYKKASFQLAEKEFEKEEWEIMNQVSGIRLQWDYKISFLQKRLLCHPSYSVRKIGRSFAPQVSRSIASKLNPSFYKRMAELIVCMQSKMNEQN